MGLMGESSEEMMACKFASWRRSWSVVGGENQKVFFKGAVGGKGGVRSVRR